MTSSCMIPCPRQTSLAAPRSIRGNTPHPWSLPAVVRPALAGLALTAVSFLRGAEEPPAADPCFPVEALKTDLRQLCDTIEQQHPAPFVFVSADGFKKSRDEAMALITRPMTVAEFNRVLMPLVAQIGCGHTQIMMPADLKPAKPPLYFPLGVSVIGDRLWVTDANGLNAIPHGSEIVDLNGRPSAEMVGLMLRTISADRNSRPAKECTLSRAFPFRYASVFGETDSFVVGYVRRGETQRQEATVAPVTRDASAAGKWMKGIFSRKTSSGDPFLEFEVLPEAKSAVLTIRSFVYYQAEQNKKFREFIDRAFARIAEEKVENLILDLRENGGGDPYAASHLLSYLEREPTRYYQSAYAGYEVLAEPVARAAKPFEGKLYVLIDSTGLSTTGHLGALIKFHKLGTIVGSETAGTYTCNAATTNVVLTETKLRLRVATGSFAVAVEGMSPQRGVIPEMAVPRTIEDEITGRDVAREAALRLIAGVSQSVTP